MVEKTDEKKSRKKTSGKDAGKKLPSVDLTREDRIGLFAARRYLGIELQRKLKLRIPFDVYFKDPLRAPQNTSPIIDQNFLVPWEPGLADGPTSARFAVVDYDATADRLVPPARWDRASDAFFGSGGDKLDGSRSDDL